MDVSFLNEKQRLAVETTEGPVMVIAGPGTGKTKTLTTRILYLMQQKKVAAENILALTFTKKAVAEIKDRVKHHASNLPSIMTFHSLGFEILSTVQKDSKIVSEKEQEKIISEILKSNFSKGILAKHRVIDLKLVITNYKNSLNLQDSQGADITNFINLYNEQLNQKNLIDHDDLLLKSYQQLVHDDQLREQYRSKYKYILIDEFQDTNKVQYELIKKILNKNNNLYIIGDPFQSIYSFRGADSTIFTVVENDFKDIKKIVLSVNYRSAKNIIAASNDLFQNTETVVSHSNEKGCVHIVRTMHEYSEADWIIKHISKKIGGIDLLTASHTDDQEKKNSFSDFAVIYRTHALARILGQKFNDSGIPYQTVGIDSPYQKPTIMFLITCLKYCSLHDMQYVKTTLDLNDTEVQYICDRLNQIDIKIKSASNLITEFIKIFPKFKDIQNKKEEYKTIQQLLSTVMRFDNVNGGIKQSIEYFDYLREHEFYDPTADSVTLLSMHAAKGLEFKYVYIIGFEEGIIPLKHQGIVENENEEKRLLYVAMTRAKQELYLLHATERNKREAILSPFSKLLKSECVSCIDDEAIVSIQKKRDEWKEKKSQLNLF